MKNSNNIPFSALPLSIFFGVTLLFNACTSKAQKPILTLEPIDSNECFAIYEWKSFILEAPDSLKDIFIKGDKQVVVKRFDSMIAILPLDTGLITLQFRKSGNVIDSYAFMSHKNELFKEEWTKLKSGVTAGTTSQKELNTWRSYTSYKLLGTKAPAFKTKDVYGNIFTNAEFEGKVTVLNFWYYGCLPCMAEMPALNKLKNDFAKDSSIQFISFFKDNIKVDSATKRLKFYSSVYDSDRPNRKYETVDFTFRQFPDTDSLAMLFNVYGYPVNMIIDSKGIIRYIFNGARLDGNDDLIINVKNAIKDSNN